MRKKPRHIRQLEQESLSVEELSELERMRADLSLTLTAEVVAALEREIVRRSSGSGGDEGERHLIQYEKHELKAKLLKGKPIRRWIRELQVMWRDSTGAQHSAYFKARDGKEQGRGSSGFIDRLELDGSPVAPPLSAGSSITGSGGFKLLLVETRSCKGKDQDEFHLKIDGLVDMGITARLAPSAHADSYRGPGAFQRAHRPAQFHGVLGQTFQAEESRKVRSLRYRLLTRLLREPVEVESESGRGFLDGRTEDYITSDIRSADCMYAAAWRRGEHESSDGSDFM
ncbi:unnamed protein product [Closterium sp. Naga37s-1]|nr:unnamed protein product [Closterium sp. Naga37s-1]